MNFENHIYSAKKALDLVNDKILAHDYDTSLALLASAYSDIRDLMEQVWKFKRSASLAQPPAVEKPE